MGEKLLDQYVDSASLITACANVLDTSEFDVFRKAYRWWFGTTPHERFIEAIFDDYIKSNLAPFFVVQFSRHVVSQFDRPESERFLSEETKMKGPAIRNLIKNIIEKTIDITGRFLIGLLIFTFFVGSFLFALVKKTALRYVTLCALVPCLLLAVDVSMFQEFVRSIVAKGEARISSEFFRILLAISCGLAVPSALNSSLKETSNFYRDYKYMIGER